MFENMVDEQGSATRLTRIDPHEPEESPIFEKLRAQMAI